MLSTTRELWTDRVVCSVISVSVIDTIHLAILFSLSKITFFICKYVIAVLFSDRIKLTVYTIYGNPKFSE